MLAKPYVDNINWTKGIDQKTGKPVDYDPNKDIQVYSGRQNQTLADRTKKLCPSMSGGNNYWPAAYSPKTKLLYIPSISSCNEVTLDTELSNKAGDWKGATFSRHRAQRDRPHRRRSLHRRGQEEGAHALSRTISGALATAGGLVFTGYTDGTFVAYDDTTLEQLWKINVGTGFNAPPMTFEVNGKQYVAILSGLSPISQGAGSSTRRSCGSSATRPCCSCSGL